MKLFNKQNTVDTKFIYQSFPFPNCNDCPSSNCVPKVNMTSLMASSTYSIGTISGGNVPIGDYIHNGTPSIYSNTNWYNTIEMDTLNGGVSSACTSFAEDCGAKIASISESGTINVNSMLTRSLQRAIVPTELAYSYKLRNGKLFVIYEDTSSINGVVYTATGLGTNSTTPLGVLSTPGTGRVIDTPGSIVEPTKYMAYGETSAVFCAYSKNKGDYMIVYSFNDLPLVPTGLSASIPMPTTIPAGTVIMSIAYIGTSNMVMITFAPLSTPGTPNGYMIFNVGTMSPVGSSFNAPVAGHLLVPYQSLSYKIIDSTSASLYDLVTGVVLPGSPVIRNFYHAAGVPSPLPYTIPQGPAHSNPTFNVIQINNTGHVTHSYMSIVNPPNPSFVKYHTLYNQTLGTTPFWINESTISDNGYYFVYRKTVTLSGITNDQIFAGGVANNNIKTTSLKINGVSAPYGTPISATAPISFCVETTASGSVITTNADRPAILTSIYF